MTPLRYFFVLFVAALGIGMYFVVELVRSGFSLPILAVALLCLAAAVAAGLDVRSHRLLPQGLLIEQRLTGRKRLIDYASIQEVSRGLESTKRGVPTQQLVYVRHERGNETLRFFDRQERDTFFRELEERRQQPS